MAVIGTIAASGNSAIFNLDYLPERLLVDSANSFAAFDRFSVVASGVQLMSLTSAARFIAVAKFDNQLIGEGPNQDIVAKYIRLATGRINKQTTIQVQDSVTGGVNYPYPVAAASTNICKMARRAVESSINPSANATFNNFEALFIEPSNLLRAQLTFDNGFTDEYSPNELRALFAAYNQSDELGGLGTYTCISGETPYGNITQAVIYASGGSVVVVQTDYVQL